MSLRISATSPASFCNLSISLPLILTERPLPKNSDESIACEDAVTLQSRFFVRFSISSITLSDETSDFSSSNIYMLTLSLPELIRFMVELPPAVAPIVSMPFISEILSMTLSDSSVSCLKSSFSSSFASMVSEI